MSQNSQELFPKSGLILPLSKFSYATSHGESTGQIPWVHLGNKHHLTAVFENKRVDDHLNHGRIARKFKVIQDPEVLEDIDIDILATEANRAIIVAQDPRRNGKLPEVVIIVKNPCVAIRYPLAGGQVRRIQMRLANNDDYYDILKILTRANVPFSEPPSAPVQPPQQFARPFSSSSSLLRPCDSASQISGRPASTLSNTGHLPNVAPAISTGWTPVDILGQTSTARLPYEDCKTLRNESSQRGSDMISRPSTDLYEDSTSVAHSSETVSSYFANTGRSNRLQNVPRSTLGFVNGHTPIDLYQPRPSTAPAADSQSLTQMLPPKRELPFKTSHSAKKSKKGKPASFVSVPGAETKLSLQSQLPPQSPKPSPPRPNSSVGIASLTSTHSVSPESSALQKSRTPSRTSLLRSQKQQSTKNSSKNSKNRGDDVVPGVKELLEETQKSSGELQEGLISLDTQALLLRAESTRPAKNSGLQAIPYRPVSRPGTTPSSPQTRKCRSCTLRKGRCDGSEPCDWCREFEMECIYTTPVEQETEIQVPSSQPAAEAAIPTAFSAAKAEKAKHLVEDDIQKADTFESEVEDASAEKPEQIVDAQQKYQGHRCSTDRNTSPLPPRNTINNTIQDLHLSHPVANPALAALYNSPGFSPTDHQQLTSWSSLPEVEQKRSLDTWICLQIQHPGFATLLKLMDESWQRNLLG